MAIDALKGRDSDRPADDRRRRRRGDAGGAGFADALGRVVQAVEIDREPRPTPPSAACVEGTADVHDAMIALQRADLTLQFSVQIRNKLVQAYQEIMRMPV